ncbi:MAG: hypothetical protein GX166_00750 [Clostridiaceae bacterium]|nr:hypothetical protein [Clostridiaceae bacterium]
MACLTGRFFYADKPVKTYDIINQVFKAGEVMYITLDNMVKRYKVHKRLNAFCACSQEEFHAWRDETRKVLKNLLGMDKIKGCEIEVKEVLREKVDGFYRDKLILKTEEDVWMPFYVLIPEDYKEGENRPCVIACHGHGSGGKLATSGRDDIKAIKNTIKLHNYDYGVKFVKRGYIVFCPDARGFGERREYLYPGDNPDEILASTCAPLNHQAISLGLSLKGLWIWALMRLIDYIYTRADCDSAKLGCCGLSGGGLQTIWLAALDDRVKCSAVSGYFYGYLDSLLKMPQNCSCNFVPNLWNHIDMGDLEALVCPRPLLIESGTRDPLNGERGIVNVTEQVEITRKAYELFDRTDYLVHFVFEGEYIWNGQGTYAFMDRHLKDMGG